MDIIFHLRCLFIQGMGLISMNLMCRKIQGMIQMIKDGKFFMDLPEDWNKIIKALRTRPMDIYELRNETNIEFEKLKEILKTMKLLDMVSYRHYKDPIKIIKKEGKNDKGH
ncbi:hypothetical protein [Acidiplasma sp.]|uniref:hypothetical protein n=1 Tax=Acidiplasma sp. TaxID=1872114 RepID=UPI002582E207|nr:hypothetical protein [Acidiplasma sp.]